MGAQLGCMERLPYRQDKRAKIILIFAINDLEST